MDSGTGAPRPGNGKALASIPGRARHFPSRPEDVLRGHERSILGAVVLFLILPVAGTSGAAAQEGARTPDTFRSRCGAGVHADVRSGWIWLPQGRIFCPLVADPKSQRSFLGYRRGDFATIATSEPDPETNIGAIGLAESFAVFRAAGEGSGNGLQLDLQGAVFAQFDLDRSSFDLINSDFLVGLPLTFRHGGFSTRLRLYHQSSHLGDEFLLAREPERINLSFESLKVILSQEMGPLRMYAGGEIFFRREPEDLAPHLAHAGLELRPLTAGDGRLLTALDLKAVEEDDEWQLAWSAKAGVEIARVTSPGHPPRVLTLVGEFYDGAAPYGQFYREDIRYFGLSLNVST